MRRTLALLGAATLAVVGLAGPANASDITAQEDIEFSSTTGINGTGVQVHTTTPHSEAFYDFVSTSGNPESLENLNVEACIGSNPDPIVFMLGSYAGTNVVPASVVFKTGDPNYSGSPNIRWDNAPTGSLFSVDFKLNLYNVNTLNVIDSTSNGTPSGTCTAQLLA